MLQKHLSCNLSISCSSHIWFYPVLSGKLQHQHFELAR